MIPSLETVASQIQAWQQSGKTVVLVTGVFDLLHIEHLRFLAAAKAAGDKLIIGLETDVRVKAIKGTSRPVNNQAIRLEQLAALKAVDLVFLLPEQFSSQTDWETVMAQLHPDIYALSSHSSHQENKRYICQKFGIDLRIVHPHNPAISTTQIIKSQAKEA